MAGRAAQPIGLVAVPSLLAQVMLDRITTLAARSGLFVMGTSTRDGHTRVLLGADRRCWPVFTGSDEYSDGRRDPLDRWSKRVIGGIASDLGAQDSYPSDGPPYAPFIAWALETGRFFQSPTGMMVHDTAGLMISIRGALHFEARLDGAAPVKDSPCRTCVDQPCVSACPVGALSRDHAYDVPACKSFLATTAGQDCMDRGCKVRRACPVSDAFARSVEQSAFHMRAFKG